MEQTCQNVLRNQVDLLEWLRWAASNSLLGDFRVLVHQLCEALSALPQGIAALVLNTPVDPQKGKPVPTEIQIVGEAHQTLENARKYAETQRESGLPFAWPVFFGGEASDRAWLLPRQEAILALTSLGNGILEDWHREALDKVLTEAIAEVRNARNCRHKWAIIAARWKRKQESQDGSLFLDFATPVFAKDDDEQDSALETFRRSGWAPIGLLASS